MKDIKAILEGCEIPDEQRDTIIREVNENYKTIVEVGKKNDRIAELEEQNRALTEQVGNLEGDGEELEKLRKQVQEFTEAEDRRKADEAESAKREQFRIVFDAAIGDKEFANDLMRETVFEKVYAKCSDQTGASAKDIIEELTKDTDGIWKNPQTDVKKMPASDITGKKSNADEASKSMLHQLFNSK